LPIGTSSPLSPWPGRIPAPSPAFVGAYPDRVTLLDGNERSVGVDARGVVSGSPAWYEDAGGRRTAVICWAGPWPVDERWWDQRARRRRRRARLQVITGTGEALLLVLDRGTWSVEGRYD
jgi:protein ImuB